MSCLTLFWQDGGDAEVSGSPTEKAILSWGIKVPLVTAQFSVFTSQIKCIYIKNYVLLQIGMKFDIIRSESTLHRVFPFNSEKKRGGVALRLVSFLLFCQ